MSKRKRINRKVLRELRKAKADLAALISYEKECNSILIEYTYEWNSDITEFLKLFDKDSEEKNPENNLQKEVFEEARKASEEKEEKEEPDYPQAPDWVKKAFRKLAMKTHPDKVADNLDSDHLVDIYSRANAAIEEKNYDLFTQICAEINIDCELDPDVELEICLKHKKSVQESLIKISQSFPWMWGESYGDNLIRKNIILSVLPHYNISGVEESKIQNFLEKLHSS